MKKRKTSCNQNVFNKRIFRDIKLAKKILASTITHFDLELFIWFDGFFSLNSANGYKKTYYLFYFTCNWTICETAHYNHYHLRKPLPLLLCGGGGHVSATWKVSFCRWRFPLTINSEKGQPSGNYLCAMFSAFPPPPEKFVLPKKLPFVGKPSPVDPIGWHPLSVAFGFHLWGWWRCYIFTLSA